MRNLPAQFNLFHALDDLISFNGSLQPRVRLEELKVDVKEDDKQYTIHADVPGVSKENINVTFDQGYLNIEVSERKENEVKEGERVIRSERYSSKKQRTFNIGHNVDESAIEAEYKDGVLTLVLPKKEVKANRMIEIK